MSTPAPRYHDGEKEIYQFACPNGLSEPSPWSLALTVPSVTAAPHSLL